MLAVEAVKGTNIEIGAENMYFEESGAFTGEISPAMLTDVGVKYVIIGHSERREYFAETDETVNKKVKKAFEHGLTPIICCGESLKQREQGITLDWIRQQIKIAFLDVTAEQAATAVIAYEPVSYTHLDVYKRQDGQGRDHCQRKAQDPLVSRIHSICLYNADNTPVVDADGLINQIIGMAVAVKCGTSFGRLLKIALHNGKGILRKNSVIF